MPATNIKIEARRMEQAKAAIKKMKRLRKEANRRPATITENNAPPVVPAPEARLDEGKSLASTAYVNPGRAFDFGDVEPSFTKKTTKMSTRKRVAKEPAVDDTVQRRRKLLSPNSEYRSPSNDNCCTESVRGSRYATLPVKESPSGSEKRRNMSPDHVQASKMMLSGEHLLFHSPADYSESSSMLLIPQGKSDVREESALCLTPSMITYDRGPIRRVYGRGSCSESSVTQDDFSRLLQREGSSLKDSLPSSFNDECSDKAGLKKVTEVKHTVPKILRSRIKVPKRVKIIKTLKIASNKVRGKGRKVNAPMSIKMSNNVVKKPLFQITSEDDQTKNDVSDKAMCKQMSAMNSSVSGYTSGFSITTVPDSDMFSDESNDEVCSNEAAENVTPENEIADSEYVDEEEEVSKEAHNDSSMMQFHFIDGQVILHLKHPSTFVFCGQVQVQVLKGAVEVLGYCLKPSCGSRTIFNPKGSSLLTLQTTVVDYDSSIIPSIDLHSSSLTALVEKGDEHDAFLLMNKTEDKLSLFLEQYMTVKLFPRPTGTEENQPFLKASNKLQCLCYPPRGCNIFKKGDSWEELSKNIIGSKGCTVVCGGKGVGKSTMLRFLINRYLSCGEQGVLLIDLDPGQAELTVPGCISLSVVKQPLLGPNFTHLQDPVKCVYIGDVSVPNCVSRFMDACLTIVDFWHSEEQWKDMPCIVNTMGFNKGLGITIMVQMLSLLQPTSVIQIFSKSKTRNYPENLTEEYVKKNCSNSPFTMQLRTLGRRLSIANILDYNLYQVQSLAESNESQTKAWGLDAKFSREIVIMSYLSKIVHPPYHSLLEVVPYCCPLDALYLSVCHEPVPPSVTVPAFNASLVALCEVNPDNSIVQASGPGFPAIITGQFTAYCLGFGIVRGIDMESKQLYLLSPVSPKILSSINCLVLGAVCIPPNIYLTPPKEPGPIPYVIASESQHAAKPSKRTFRYSKSLARSAT